MATKTSSKQTTAQAVGASAATKSTKARKKSPRKPSKTTSSSKATKQRRWGFEADASSGATTADAADQVTEAKLGASPSPTSTVNGDGDQLVVFAIRLTRAERDAIHEAAGSGKASRFVRGVALAAARRDVSALQAVIAEAEASRSQ